MSSEIRVLRGEATLVAAGVSPAFGLSRDSSFVEALYAAVAPFGLRLGDIRWEQGNGSVGDGHMFCALLGQGWAVRVRMESVEIAWFDLTRGTFEQVGRVVSSVLEGLASQGYGKGYQSYSLTVAAHGAVPGSGDAIVSRFVTSAPSDQGPQLGAGCSFYFGPLGSRISSSVTVEPSAMFQEALFVRLSGLWDGTAVGTSALPNLAEEHVNAVLRSLGLVLAKG